MNDVLNLVAFAGKVACLVVFVAVLKPDVIKTVEAPLSHQCQTARSGSHGCGLAVAAAMPEGPVGHCCAVPERCSVPNGRACRSPMLDAGTSP